MIPIDPLTSPPVEHVDVIVVGATISGLATAMLLARRRLRVVVIDTAPSCEPAPVAVLSRTGVALLARWGVLDDLPRAGSPAVDRVTFHSADESVSFTVRPSLGVTAFYSPTPARLLRLLRTAAEAAGADIRDGVEVVGVAAGSQPGIQVQLTSRGLPTRALHGHLAVGADGMDSAVAGHVGAVGTLAGLPSRSTASGRLVGVPVDGHEWFFLPDIRIGLGPSEDGATWLTVTRPPGVPAVDTMDDLLAAVGTHSDRLARRLAGGEAASGFVLGTAGPEMVRPARGDGWALVGAAGLHQDVTGPQGCSGPLRDAELLARALPLGLDHRDVGPALARYAQSRDDIALPVLRAVVSLTADDWDVAPLGLRLRRLSSAMADEAEAVAGRGWVASPSSGRGDDRASR